VRLLARTRGCHFSKSALSEAVSVYVALAEVPRARTFGHVRASHVVTVLSLEGAERKRLLEIAELERLSVRKLRQRVAELTNTADLVSDIDRSETAPAKRNGHAR
jgi:hypothetical protein